MSPADADGRGDARGDRAGDRESPPRRLTEEPAPAPGSAEALVVAFLRASGPYRTPLGRRERLQATVAGARRARPVRSFSRPAFALGVSVCIAATVSAHLLGWPRWLADRLPGQAPPEPGAAATVALTADVAGASPAHPKQEPLVEPPAPPVAAPPVPVAESSPTPQRVAERSAPTPRHRTRHQANAAQTSTTLTVAQEHAAIAATSPAPQPAPAHAEAAKVTRREPTTAEEDAALALAALRALRRDHDPARARAMVDAYLRAHPDSSMAEEALAISIEAAAAHHDADAKALAARYLALYPTGTFRALARQTLRSDAESQ